MYRNYVPHYPHRTSMINWKLTHKQSHFNKYYQVYHTKYFTLLHTAYPFTLWIQCFPCYMISEVGHLAVFLSLPAQNLPELPPRSYFLLQTCCYLVVMHLFPLYFAGNKLKHPSECTILKIVFLNVSRWPCCRTQIVCITHSTLAQPILPTRPSFYSEEILRI